jgi:DNA mismatch endonuclease, patch repair protein
MRRQRRSNTAPEVEIRRELHRRGLRYRVNWRPEADLRVRADIAWPRRRLLVFIDGCYWHACPIHGTRPKSNSEWWNAKLAANVARDAQQTNELTARGWTVRRYWEHEDPQSVALDIESLVKRP